MLKNNDIKNVVNIYKRCVSITNSQVYPDDIVKAWLERISEKNVKAQLNNSSWCVLKEKEIVIGFCQWGLEEQILYEIQIDPDYQRRGYGTSLYLFIEDVFIKYEKNLISLNSTINAVPFYDKMGFKSLKDIICTLNESTSIQMVSMEKKLL